MMVTTECLGLLVTSSRYTVHRTAPHDKESSRPKSQHCGSWETLEYGNVYLVSVLLLKKRKKKISVQSCSCACSHSIKHLFLVRCFISYLMTLFQTVVLLLSLLEHCWLFSDVGTTAKLQWELASWRRPLTRFSECSRPLSEKPRMPAYRGPWLLTRWKH